MKANPANPANPNNPGPNTPTPEARKFRIAAILWLTLWQLMIVAVIVIAAATHPRIGIPALAQTTAIQQAAQAERVRGVMERLTVIEAANKLTEDRLRSVEKDLEMARGFLLGGSACIALLQGVQILLLNRRTG